MTYVFQSYSVGDVLTAAAMNQEEVNIRDHVHGASGVTGTMRTITPETDMLYAVGGNPALRWLGVNATETVDFNTLSYGNSVTETIVWSYALPGNTLGSNRALALEVTAHYSDLTGANIALTTRAKYGTTTFASTIKSTAAVAANSGSLISVFLLQALGTTSLQAGTPVMCTLANSNDAVHATQFGGHGVSSFATDTTTQQPLSVTFQWTGASTSRFVEKRIVRVIRIQ